jgi:cytochrome c oxidase assembly protein subunit 15
VTLPRISPHAYARVTVGALVALIVIIITGAAVRLTGSGLGCPDWPTCDEGRVVAPLSYHAMIEFVNRVFTGVVSLAVILAVLGALLRSPRRRDLTYLSLSLVLGVLAQAIIGGLTVLNDLRPEWVMAHFVVSMLLIWAALVLVHRARQPDSPPFPVAHRDYRLLARAMAVVAAVVIFVGTMVTGSGPHGGDEHVVRLDFALHTITKVHGGLVWLLVALTVLTMWRLHAAGVSRTLLRRGEFAVAAMLVQGAIGYLQYGMHLPPLLVLLHIGGSVAVWLTVLWFNLGFYERYETADVAGIPVYDGNAVPVLDDMLAD